MSNPEDSAIKPTTTEEAGLTKGVQVEEGAGVVKDGLDQKDSEESTKPAPSKAEVDDEDDDDEPVPPGHNARGRPTNAASGLSKPVKR